MDKKQALIFLVRQPQDLYRGYDAQCRLSYVKFWTEPDGDHGADGSSVFLGSKWWVLLHSARCEGNSNENGATVSEIETQPVHKVVTAETSKLLRGYLYKTVEEGTAKAAQVKGYKVGGKTGTAEKYPRKRKIIWFPLLDSHGRTPGGCDLCRDRSAPCGGSGA